MPTSDPQKRTLSLTDDQLLHLIGLVLRDLDEARREIIRNPEVDEATHAFNEVRILLDRLKSAAGIPQA
jgi:hypothetical protein